jgi:hypothetical protein
MTNKLKQWMRVASTEQKEQLALASGSSVPSIRLASNGYRTGGEVDLTAEFAQRIANGIALVNVGTKLPEVKQEDLCKACAACSYQKRCNSK